MPGKLPNRLGLGTKSGDDNTNDLSAPAATLMMETITKNTLLQSEVKQKPIGDVKRLTQKYGPDPIVPQDNKHQEPSRKAKILPMRTHRLPVDIHFTSRMLARLDEDSFESALQHDIRAYFTTDLFPSSFQWHRPRIHLQPTIPRDIDDMHGILYAEDKTDDPNCLFREMNCRRGTTTLAWGGKAVSRRSDDEGVVELKVLLPKLVDKDVPHSIIGTVSSPEEAAMRKRLFLAGELAEVASCVPWRWDSQDANANDKNDHSPEIFRKRKRSDDDDWRSKTWFVSAKVNHVTSRRTLFPSWHQNVKKSENEDDSEDDETVDMKSCEGGKKPLLCRASFPAWVQTGRCVTVSDEELQQTGNENRESFECKPNPKKERNRRIRIYVGRTRRIWTCPRDGGYSSSLSGAKLDAAAYKRPREARVGIKVNGELIYEDDKINDNEHGANVCLAHNNHKEGSGRVKKSKVERWSFSNALCTLSKAAYLEKLVSDAKKEKRKEPRPSTSPHDKPSLIVRISSMSGPSKPIIEIEEGSQCLPIYLHMRHGLTMSLKHIPPRLDIIPMDDGFLRAVCTLPGSMSNVGIHSMLNQIAKKQNVCTVCWTPNNVMECVDCGLMVHLECCLEKGKILRSDDPSGDRQYVDEAPVEASIEKDKQAPKWRCVICSEQTRSVPVSTSRKPRRTSKVPSRFADDEGWELPRSMSGKKTKYRPSHKCSLCPHSGGAMSRLCQPVDSENRKGASWTHEVCRIWCGARSGGDYASADFRFRSGRVCALCGRAGKASSSENDEVSRLDDCDVGAIGQSMFGSKKEHEYDGLVKCAEKGCYVMVHPLCALLVTKLATEDAHFNFRRKNLGMEYDKDGAMLRNLRRTDESLANRYTFKLLEVTKTEGSFGNLKGQSSSTIVPVVYCGLHNPDRERSLRGCPPGGRILGSCMRIPTMQRGQDYINDAIASES